MHEPNQERRPSGAEWEVLTGPGGDRDPRGSLPARWRRQPARVRAVTVAVAVGALALGGTVAYAAASGHSAGDAVPAAAGSSAPASPSGHGHGPWFGLGGDAVHGEATVKDRDSGKWVVRIWQRGTVEKADGDQVTVKSEDGAAWTWTVGSDVTVRGDGVPDAGAGALKKGDAAFLIGTRSTEGTRTAAVAFTGTFADWGLRGFRGHGGPWGRPDRGPSPSPSGSGATT
ncbi:hypothetical protein [Streptomyces sp. NPDC051636]|uniref:hypothetical protein n=1 Tax=Streptomyces sp. NPDC051636 TaxID=3365663 RepID=UPI00379B46B7